MTGLVAMAANRTIGLKGGLPWAPIPEDFRHFRRLTMDKDVVVGNNTFKELPFLKGRRIWVLSRGSVPYTIIKGESWPYAAINDIDLIPKNAIICGGAQVYKEMLPFCETFWVSRIKEKYTGDTFMPPFEHLFKKSEIIQSFSEFEIIQYTK